jgi:hypothetical protein
MSFENRVLSEVFYIARLLPLWQTKPYWLMRRCVVPYINSRQFLVLRKDDLPVAFAAWVWEGDENRNTTPAAIASSFKKPWRQDNYLPSASDFLQTDGDCCVTEMMSPLIPANVVMAEVANWLNLVDIPVRIEVNGERKIMAVHQPPTNPAPCLVKSEKQ